MTSMMPDPTTDDNPCPVCAPSLAHARDRYRCNAHREPTPQQMHARLRLAESIIRQRVTEEGLTLADSRDVLGALDGWWD